MNSLVRDVTIDDAVSADVFRDAMRNLAGGVSVITVGRGSDISGMTVTSVSSLSIEPASLVVCINRQSSSWPLLRQHGVFGVNILASDQTDVAERFTGKGGLRGAARFAEAKWVALASGVPLLAGALVAIDCEVEQVVERHSHAIVIGRVLALQIESGKLALGYWHGKYIAVDRQDVSAGLTGLDVPTAWALREV